MSDGEGAEEKEKEKEYGSPKREESWALEEGAQPVLEGDIGY